MRNESSAISSRAVSKSDKLKSPLWTRGISDLQIFAALSEDDEFIRRWRVISDFIPRSNQSSLTLTLVKKWADSGCMLIFLLKQHRSIFFILILVGLGGNVEFELRTNLKIAWQECNNNVDQNTWKVEQKMRRGLSVSKIVLKRTREYSWWGFKWNWKFYPWGLFNNSSTSPHHILHSEEWKFKLAHRTKNTIKYF